MNEATAVLGLISALVGLLAAYIGRKKKIEYVVKLDNSRSVSRKQSSSTNKKWYDYKFIVAICMVFFFPLGFYGLYQSRTISKFWKWFWFLAFTFFVALAMDA